MIIKNDAGHYRFHKGIAPYSCGVVAEPRWEIVHVTLSSWLPWREGFELIDDYLRQVRLGRVALCAVELRSPAPFSMEGFIEFNRGYRAVLEHWELLVEGLNPIARTNVAPVNAAPAAPSLHGFSYVRPNRDLKRATFVVAGAGELREGTLDSRGIIRRGETSLEALCEKAAYVLDVMEDRLCGLSVGWDQVTAVDIYTIHSLEEPLHSLLLGRIGPAARHGLRWYLSQPPVTEIEFEMDVRGVACEVNW